MVCAFATDDTWCPIDPNAQLPYNAEVDWENGVARIPTVWPLILSRSSLRVGCLSSEEHNGYELVVPTMQADDKVTDVLVSMQRILQRRVGHAAKVPDLYLIVVKTSAMLDVPEPRELLKGASTEGAD